MNDIHSTVNCTSSIYHTDDDSAAFEIAVSVRLSHTEKYTRNNNINRQFSHALLLHNTK